MSSLIFIKTWQHLQLTFISLFISMLIAIPLGIFLALTKYKKLASIVFRFVAAIQTIPGLALIALIVVFLVLLRPFVHLPTTGFLPAVIVLVLYALLPILSNTYEGIKQVSSSSLEVAKAMGMTPFQLLFWIRLPLSLPLLFTGVRISLVYTISLVTLTSLVGSGGLGDLIVQGLRTMQFDLVLAGTFPAAGLAILFDFTLARAAKWVMPQSQG